MIPVEELTELCNQVNGECGLYISVPGENERFALNEDALFYSASTIKIPILCLLFRDAEQGRVDLTKKSRVRQENRVGGSGILQSLSPELEISLFDLANLMIVMSDNIATNEVIDAVGMARVRDFCRDNGYHNTWIWRKMMNKSVTHPPHMPEGTPPNATCAGDLGRMMEAIAAGRIAGEQSCRKMIQIMGGQRLGRLKTLLPCVKRLDPYEKEWTPPVAGRVAAASKGGTLTSLGCAHDAAIFYLPDGRYYVMVMCTRSKDVSKTTEIIQKAGLVMYEALK